MSVETKVDMSILVASDSTFNEVKASIVVDEKITSVFAAESSARLNLAASASDIVFNFQSVVDGQFVVIRSNKECTVKINGAGSPAITLKPAVVSGASGAEIPGFLVLNGGGVTSLHFGNPDANNAIDVDIGVAGSLT